MVSADQIIEKIPNFKASEFPCDLKLINANILFELQELRAQWARPIHPSRHVLGAARVAGRKDSRHYAGEGRLADAVDVFPEGNVLETWLCAQSRKFGGIGVYFDTRKNKLQPGLMLHLDMRPERTLWMRDRNGNYHTLHGNESGYRKLADHMIQYLEQDLKAYG